MSGKPGRGRYALRNKEGEYYTVFGWTPTTTKKVMHAVIFPNELLAHPSEGKWEKVPVESDGAFWKERVRK